MPNARSISVPSSFQTFASIKTLLPKATRPSLKHLAAVLMLGVVFHSTVVAQPAAKTNAVAISQTPSWVWLGPEGKGDSIAMRREFVVDGTVKQAMIAASADNHCKVFINGTEVLSSDEWSEFTAADISKQLKPGTNVIAMTASNDGGAAGVLVYVQIVTDTATIELTSDSSWQATTTPKGDWKAAGYDAKEWKSPRTIGELGTKRLPWSGSINRDSLLVALGNENGGDFFPQIAENAQVPEGFKIEKIFHVPRSMGS
jgi:hypothetical protein